MSQINLQKEIKKFLDDFGDEATEIMQEEASKAIKTAVKRLRTKKSFAARPKRNAGAYARSWTQKTENSRVGASAVAFNSKHYRLTHLLENGHVSRNGTGRTYGSVPAYPHIAEINDEAQKEFTENVERRLKG